MTYLDAVTYLYNLGNSGGTQRTASLDRMRALLDTLGSPEFQFKSIHIAGTKGKGSSAAMLDSCLRAHNISTGLFTSPHLHTLRERMRVSGQFISEADVVRLTGRLRPIVESLTGATTFEALTAMAFLHFAESKVAWAVIECGVGGRLDSTNVLAPCACLITSISFDHTAWLGGTLALIAGEKAGIIKRGVPVISHQQHHEAQNVIETSARERGAPLTLMGRHWRWSTMSKLSSRDSSMRDPFDQIHRSGRVKALPPSQSFEVKQVAFRRSEAMPYPNDLEGIYDLPLFGAHQLENATGVIATLDVLRRDPTNNLKISAAAIQNGLHNTHWPGRLELLRTEPPLIVDGAHNVDSINKMAAALAELFSGVRWTVIFGCYLDKDAAGMLKSLAPRTARWIFVQSRSPRAIPVEQLLTLATSQNLRNCSGAASVEDAINATRNVKEAVCVCGSLSVVAEARESWLPGSIEKDPV